ncbi:hypothetical protein Tco_0490866 [Tanacetum coccineum]
MTQDMVMTSLLQKLYIPTEVIPLLRRDKLFAQFPAGKEGYILGVLTFVVIGSFTKLTSCVFPISIPLYTRGVLEKDSAPHLIARQEKTIKFLKARISIPPYQVPSYSCDMGLLDFIKTTDPRKVRAVEVQKRHDQVTLLESTRHCFMPLVIPATGEVVFVAATNHRIGP